MTVTREADQPLKIADLRGGNKLSQGDWTWIRSSIFLKWSNCHDKDNAFVVLVIFSASQELKDRFRVMWELELSGVLVDPFSLVVICLDQMWLQAQGIVSNVGSVFGEMERVS